MKGQFFKYWDQLRSSFWFVPAIMAIGAVALAFAAANVDEALTTWLTRHLGLEFTGGAEGASAVMSVIAGSMITIAGVVFSMTLVALSLATSQLGPRLLRNFMRDTTTQVVLGTFIATFLYCLLVLRTIRRAEEIAFVPHLAVTVGVLLAVASVGVLIYFIHHVSVSIQVNAIVARIGDELITRVETPFPSEIGREATADAAPLPDGDASGERPPDALAVLAESDGYLQFIDGKALLTIAQDADVVVHLIRSPGNYIVAGSPLALVAPARGATDAVTLRMRGLFVLGHQRTSSQDIEFGINQLVEIAIRALSPGINDPFTAMTCVDRLASVLSRVATRDIPSAYRADEAGRLRVVAQPTAFPELMDAAFNQLRQYGRTSAAVSMRLLEALSVIAGFVHRAEDRAAVLGHAEMIARTAKVELSEAADLRALADRHQAVLRA